MIDTGSRFLNDFPKMPFLTELWLEIGPVRLQPAKTSGSFLAGLPHLQHLTMHDILDGEDWKQAMGYKSLSKAKLFESFESVTQY